MIRIGNVPVDRSNHPFTLIAGPCVMEDERHPLFMAEAIARICADLDVPFVFKSSFDKANRTSHRSARGVGMAKGIEVFARLRDRVGCPLLTDVHEPWQCGEMADAVDCLQIPAFLCRQTDLIVAAARSGRTVNIKKGQWLAPESMAHAAEKARWAGAVNVILTERGTAHGYGDMIVDMRSLVLMADFDPVVFDATHSLQRPGGATTGGSRELVPVLARAAVAVGVAGLFMEVHDDPDNDPSDGPNMVRLADLHALLAELLDIDAALHR